MTRQNFELIFDSQSNFPPQWSEGVLYIDTSTEKRYRWNGTQYITPNVWAWDVLWPISSTDNYIARAKWTNGKEIDYAPAQVDDNGSIDIPTGQSYKINWTPLSKSDIWLGSVNNTSDAAKPVSTATLTALDGKQDISEKGSANWYASLNSTSKVPASQLPSYVDDVEEYADLWSLPWTWETWKIYVTLDSNMTYRWSWSAYIKLNDVDLSDYVNKTTDTLDDITAGTTNQHFSDIEKTKLTGIEDNATADQTDAEIKIAYENNADTNAFTDSSQTKLDGIESGAEVNVQADWNQADNTQDAFIQNKPTLGTVSSKNVGNQTGQIQENGAILWNSEIVETDATGKFITAAKNTAFNKNFWNTTWTVCEWDDSRLLDERAPLDNSATNAKLADMASQTIKWRNTAWSWNPEDLTPTQVRSIINVEDWATSNDTDDNLKNRANHTGTQTASTISDFDSEVSNNTDVSANTTHRGQTDNPHSVNKAQVGLGNVTNDAQLTIANNLSDVNNRQTALNNITNVSSSTNEHVLTKDTATGDVIFKAIPSLQALLPTGSIIASIGNSLTWALKFDGSSSYSKVTYSTLYALISAEVWTAYDVDSNNFYLPNASGRVLGIAWQGSGLTLRDIFDSVWSETHTLTLDEMASHSHAIPIYQNPGGTSDDYMNDFGYDENEVVPSWTDEFYNSANNNQEWNEVASLTNAKWGNQAHNNMQPTMFAGKNLFIYY